MRHLGKLGSAAFLLVATVVGVGVSPRAMAQDRSGTVEITPFGGAYFGGRLYAGSNAIFSEDVRVREAGTYGVRVGMNANRWLGIEAGFSTARADIRSTGDSTLFGSSTKIGTMDVQHYELNAVFNIGHRRVIPYVTLGGGATRFDARVPGVDSSPDTKFTANLGAGVKTFFNPHLALRFDGRYRSAFVDDRDCDRHSSSYCDDHRRNDDKRRWYGSAELTGGLTFAF